MTHEQPKCPSCNRPIENCECKEQVRKFKEERYKDLEVVERREVQIGDHKIEIINYNPDIPITQEHLEKLEEVFRKVWEIAPEAVRQCDFLVITAQQSPKRSYSKYESYGQNIDLPNNQKIIEFTPLGARLNESYRSSDMVVNKTGKDFNKTSNFEGTLLHELAHNIIDSNLVREWEEKFGWQNDSILVFYAKRETDGKPIYETSGKISTVVVDELRLLKDGWEKEGEESEKFLTHNQTGYRVGAGSKVMPPSGAGLGIEISNFTTEPEKCVTDYARTNSAEDLCESFVAYFFNPEILDPEKRQMIEEWVQKKKAEREK